MATIPHTGDFQWQGVDVLKYKEVGDHFKDITRQKLYAGCPDLPTELRYFEIAAGGHSTLERHEHVHFIMIIRGSGEALVDGQVRPLATLDMVEIPSRCWHQFRATKGAPFGFLCIVSAERDRPEHPTDEQIAEMKKDPTVAAFIRY